MGIGFRELLVILAIALLIFGGKKLRTMGSDLGSAVRSFRKSFSEGGSGVSDERLAQDESPNADSPRKS